VMNWGNPGMSDSNYAGAWKFVYGMDPDLRSCTITLKVHPPERMDFISFALKDASGNMASWLWDTPAAIPYSSWPQFTTITLKTNSIAQGTTAVVPNATSFALNPNFDLSKVASFIINETWHDTPGVYPAPPPGGGGSFVGFWNAWDTYNVTKNMGTGKNYIKWSQPPDNNDPNADPPIFIGWDERSDFNRMPTYPIVADDWECNDSRPVTDIHWWGSFIGWNQPYPPPIVPKCFHIGIWTDTPDPDPNNPANYSHPKQLVWVNDCTCWVWNFAGFDSDPRGPNNVNDSCFQFNQLLSEPNWFWQEPNDPNNPGSPRIYWLSIAAEYNPSDYYDPNFYPWGWKTRKHVFNDDAVRIKNISPKPIGVGSSYIMGTPIYWPDVNSSWDMAFELTTNEPNEPVKQYHTDFNNDGIVNFNDFAIFAATWLTADP